MQDPEDKRKISGESVGYADIICNEVTLMEQGESKKSENSPPLKHEKKSPRSSKDLDKRSGSKSQSPPTPTEGVEVSKFQAAQLSVEIPRRNAKNLN